MSQRSTKRSSFITPGRLSQLSPCEEDQGEGHPRPQSVSEDGSTLLDNQSTNSPSISIERNEFFEFGLADDEHHACREIAFEQDCETKEFVPMGASTTNQLRYNDYQLQSVFLSDPKDGGSCSKDQRDFRGLQSIEDIFDNTPSESVQKVCGGQLGDVQAVRVRLEALYSSGRSDADLCNNQYNNPENTHVETMHEYACWDGQHGTESAFNNDFTIHHAESPGVDFEPTGTQNVSTGAVQPVAFSALGQFLGDCQARINRDGKVKVGDWVCPSCANMNQSFRLICNLCKGARCAGSLAVFEVQEHWQFFGSSGQNRCL